MASDSNLEDDSLVQDLARLELTSSVEALELSISDLVSARDALLQFFPPELVYIILDLAEYWVRTTSTRNDANKPIDVSASHFPAHNAALCYLTTSPILDADQDEDVHLKLMRVAYIIVSHDQGWCSDSRIRETYHGYTWFEAAILRPGQITGPGGRSWLERAVEHPITMNADTGYEAAIEVGDAGGNTRWAVQKNFTGSRDFRRHYVTWDVDGTVMQGSTTGGCDGAGFMERLSSGDHIAVIARAQYPAWRNVIEHIDVSVYYGLV
ncbi:hypothetical protein FB451DRAFT_1270933 [Mycena latifolia]|nr:hypothetical protein FB451DRAFT_1270933 [Mycena latifolia]